MDNLQSAGREEMSNEEMIVALNTVVEALGRHDLEIILADNKRLREENERLKKENGTLRKTIADWEMIDAKAKEEGAREMLAWIVDNHWALGGMADSQEKTMQLWRAGRK